MDFNPFCRRPDDLFDRVQVKRQRDERDAGCTSKISRMERGSRDYGISPTTSEPDAVVLPRTESEEKGCAERKVMNGHALHDGGKAYLPPWNVLEAAPANVIWERLKVSIISISGSTWTPSALVDSQLSVVNFHEHQEVDLFYGA